MEEMDLFVLTMTEKLDSSIAKALNIDIKRAWECSWAFLDAGQICDKIELIKCKFIFKYCVLLVSFLIALCSVYI